MAASQRSIELAGVAALAAASVKADEIIALDVSAQLVLTDVFVIAAGHSERQVGAIVDAIAEAMHKAGAPLVRSEGKNEGRWVLLDYNDVIVHVQHVEDRQYYALERLWRDCPIVALPAGVYAPIDDSLRSGDSAQPGDLSAATNSDLDDNTGAQGRDAAGIGGPLEQIELL